MGTKNHADIAVGAPANASVFNTPLGQLDDSLADVELQFGDFVVSGGLAGTSVSLVITVPATRAYVQNARIVMASQNLTVTASKDNYVDLDNTGTYYVVPVNLGAAAPPITGNAIRLFKAVASATAVTSVADLRPLALNLPTVKIAGGPWLDITHPIFAGGAPTDGRDGLASMQAAQNKAITYPNGVATLLYPSGTFGLSGMFAVTARLTLRGGGGSSSIIRPLAAIQSCLSIQAGGRVTGLAFIPTAVQQAGTTLAVAGLTQGTTYTQITVATVPAGGWVTGTQLTIGPPGGGTSQNISVTAGPYSAGGTNVVVSVTSFRAILTFAIGSTVQDIRYAPSAFAADAIQLSAGSAAPFLDNLLFFYVNGWTVNWVPIGGLTAFFTYVFNIYAQHCGSGMHIQGSTSASSVSLVMTQVAMDTMDAGPAFQLDGGTVGVHDVQATNVWGGGPGGCFHLINDVAGVWFTDFDTGGIPGFQQVGILIENPAAGASKARQVYFVAGIVQTSSIGISITDCTDVTFDDVNISRNASHGVSVSVAAAGTAVFDNCVWTQNNQGNTAATAEFNSTAASSFKVVLRTPRFFSTLVTTCLILPSPNSVVVVDYIMSGPPSLASPNRPAVVDTNFGGAGAQGKTIQTHGATAALVLDDDGGNGAGFQLLSSGGSKYVRCSGTLLQFLNSAYSLSIGQLDDSGRFAAGGQLYPGAEALGVQTTGGILHSTGVPSNANGNNNDWCISDNGNQYFRSGGVWAVLDALKPTAQSTPANPTGTASTTGVMMGMAGSITPKSTGRVLIVISGDIFNATAIADGGKVQIRHGTGTAPINGAALTGTADGGIPVYITATTAEKAPFALNAIVTGLALGTAVWLDASLAAITGGTATIENVSISAVEI